MGNRAYITTEDRQLGMYLHWNGGRDSVEAFLNYCQMHHYDSPDRDGYGWARLAQVIGNFFGGGTSVGIYPYPGDDAARHTADDNGVYIIKDYEIIDRVYPEYWDPEYPEERQNYDFTEMLVEIDKAQPEDQQLGAGFICAEQVPIADIHVGDEVFLDDALNRSGVERCTVVGIGDKGRVVNGGDVSGIPYVNRYSPDSPESNSNNYIARWKRVWNQETASYDWALSRDSVRLASRAPIEVQSVSTPAQVAEAAKRVSEKSGVQHADGGIHL